MKDRNKAEVKDRRSVKLARKSGKAKFKSGPKRRSKAKVRGMRKGA